MIVACPNSTLAGRNSRSADSTPMATETSASISADANPANLSTLPVPKLNARLAE